MTLPRDPALYPMLAGTGKTRIAVELIRQHSQQLIARSQVAVFLTPSVPLGAQVGAGARWGAWAHDRRALPALKPVSQLQLPAIHTLKHV